MSRRQPARRKSRTVRRRKAEVAVAAVVSGTTIPAEPGCWSLAPVT